MGRIDIQTTVSKLEAETISERSKGLTELRRLLGSQESIKQIDKLGDDGFHWILETLFRTVCKDKAASLHGSTTAKARAQARLQDAALALRSTIEVCVSRISHATARAVIDHVVDVLVLSPTNNEDFHAGRNLFAPLQNEYCKILRVVLSHVSHVEHLRGKHVRELAEFILASLAETITTYEDRLGSNTAVSLTSFGSRTRASQSQTSNSGHDKVAPMTVIDDLLTSLASLTAVFATNLVSSLGNVSQVVLDVLDAVSRSARTAFEILSDVLFVCLTENLALATHTVERTLPHLSRLWEDSNTVLREQMLKFLYLSRSILQARSVLVSSIDRNVMRNVAHTLSSEYGRRQDRTRLKIGDLNFPVDDKENFFNVNGVEPKTDSRHAVMAWSTVSLLVLICKELDAPYADVAGSSSSETRATGKRLKLSGFVESQVELCSSSDEGVRFLAVQSLFFAFGREFIGVDNLQKWSRELLRNVHDDDKGFASWILLVMGHWVSSHPIDETIELKAFVRDLWSTASRLLTSEVNCSAAAYVMARLVEANSIDQAILRQTLERSIFQGAGRGPLLLSEATSSLHVASLRFLASINERLFTSFSDKVLNWLEGVWMVPSFTMEDHMRTARIADAARPSLLTSVLLAIAQRFRPLAPRDPATVSSAIYAAHLEDEATLGFSRFIILSDYVENEHVPSPAHSGLMSNPSSRSPNIDSISAFLSLKLKALQHAYVDARTKAASDTTGSSFKTKTALQHDDAIEILVTACTVVLNTISILKMDMGTTGLHDLLTSTWDMITQAISERSGDHHEDALARVAARLTDVPMLRPEELQCVKASRLNLVSSLLKQMHMSSENRPVKIVIDADFEEEVEYPSSRQSQNMSQNVSAIAVLKDILPGDDGHTRFVQSRIQLAIESSESISKTGLDSGAAFVDILLSMSPADLMLARPLLAQALQDDIALTRVDMTRLLRHVAAICLQEQQYERNEGALCFCLRVLRAFTSQWVSDDDDELCNTAWDIYSWFVDVSSRNKLVSNNVMLGLAALYEIILARNPRYGAESLPSARTNLLQILQNAGCGLKFLMVQSLAKLFEGYVLTQHPAVYDDIVNQLPVDDRRIEGIAARLFVISSLGKTWNTVLRQTTYHIFETVANVPDIAKLTTRCLENVAKSIELTTPRDLLRLYAPPILYTWLEDGAVETMPFFAFGFQTLKDMIEFVEDEIVAQVSMRDISSQQSTLEKVLDKPWTMLVKQHYGRHRAYQIAASTTQRSKADLTNASMMSEASVDEESVEAARSHLHEIVAVVLLSLRDDKGFEKALLSSPQLKTAKQSFDKMSGLSASDVQPPARQQPSFRSRDVMRLLTKACNCAQVDLADLWSPALVNYVLRKIIDDSVPAMGPLHALSNLRKIRILVALADPGKMGVNLLQSLLGKITPFLTIFQCAEDASGIFCHVLDQALATLESNCDFLLGLSLTIFTSMPAFVTLEQESTTQDSHFRATMECAQRLVRWLGEYLRAIKGKHLSEKQKALYQEMVSAGENCTATNSSDRHSPNGRLLHALLRDQASSSPMVAKEYFVRSLRALARDFTIVDDVSDDILNDRREVIKCAAVLWTTIADVKAYNNFRAWVMMVCGKAYSFEGPRLSILKQHHLQQNRLMRVSHEHRHSLRGILVKITETVSGLDPATAGVAEVTLQYLATMMSPKEKHLYATKECDIARLEDLTLIAPSENMTFPTVHVGGSDTVLDDHRCNVSAGHWAQRLSFYLIDYNKSSTFLHGLRLMIHADSRFAELTLRYVLHIALEHEVRVRQQDLSDRISALFNARLLDENTERSAHRKLVLDCLVYLRACAFPEEKSIAARNSWLNIDFVSAAQAATAAGMPHTALMFLEIETSEHALRTSRSSRRSSVKQQHDLPEFTDSVLQSVDDLDFFYGHQQGTGVTAVLAKLKHERLDVKAMALQNAIFDSRLKSGGLDVALRDEGVPLVSTLTLANLHGLAYATQQFAGFTSNSIHDSSAFPSALNTHQWDFGTIETDNSGRAALQSMLQTVSTVASRRDAQGALNRDLSSLSRVVDNNISLSQMNNLLASSGAISEVKELLSKDGTDAILDCWVELTTRSEWANKEDLDSWSILTTSREATFAAFKRNEALQSNMSLDYVHLLLLEISAVRSSLEIASQHSESQFLLARALYLRQLGFDAAPRELVVEAAVTYDLANTLWLQGEISAPIDMLLQLEGTKGIEKQAIPVDHTVLMTNLGQKLADARLRRADEVTTNYLMPAIKALGSKTKGSRAGRAFHSFAAFCDQQLRDQTSIDELDRAARIKEQKLQEMHELEQMASAAKDKVKENLKAHHKKARQWYNLDVDEWQRLHNNREQLSERCLENYLLSLQACDDYKNDVLRFLARWMAQPEQSDAHMGVYKHMSGVPSHKFAPFVNQLSSRLSKSGTVFQKVLFDLLYRICREHPFHGMYQLFAATKSTTSAVAQSDPKAASRLEAAKDLALKFRDPSAPSAQFWHSIHNTNIVYVKLAHEENGNKELKSGMKVPMTRFRYGEKLVQTVRDVATKIPPPTMHLDVRADKDYSHIPVIAQYDPTVAIAGGMSAPKIATVVASDGTRHKLLLKGGHDDLRQDAIMEQVFAQVSNLLGDYRPTRKRSLGIRTYKVIPLTFNSGIIEFVKDTLPLNDYLLPAHQKYYPKDHKPNKCRTLIFDAQSKPTAQRIQAYRNVCDNFHPVMRFFFMERFMDPDEWFHRRLAYSRSAAAISILGYILGLGDRHGHNILLDEQTGEVVHIDLGVAFEAGRVLPVPETVPFRLTRDLVDGMGFTGVEGPFRRCCNFTLEALRKHEDVIMTILDVLRWDPLYSWSVSPLRLQRMQAGQEAKDAAAADGAKGAPSTDSPSAAGGKQLPTRAGAAAAAAANREKERDGGNELGEADRALSVVQKKLSAALSVEATVNELILQATDERNLALLYCGWAAYA